MQVKTLFEPKVQVQVTISDDELRLNRGEQKQRACATHGVLWWSWGVLSRTLLTQTGNPPRLFKLSVEHSEDQHHTQTL